MSGRSVRNGSGGSCCGESFCAKTTATTVNQLLWQAVRRFGERPALAWEQQGKSCRMTYSELGEEVLRLAKQLQRQGVTRNSRVAILAERRAELILAEAAVICAGGAFCCLDPEAPPQRNQLILADLQPSVFLCQQHLLNKLSPGAAQWKTVVLPLETFCCKQTSSQRTEVTIHNNNNNNVDKELLEEEKEEDIQVNNRPEDLAYLVYTSGTTGKPKGVMVTHQNLVNFVESSMRRTCHHRKQLHRTTSIARRTEEEADKHEGEQEEHHWYYEEGDRTLPTAAVQFDIHVMEVWCALSAGASLFLIAKWEVLDSSFLAQYLGKHNEGTPFRPPWLWL
ncbi:Amino acid adenylation domain-containing protein [Balamuthia mandrillaris]